MYINIDCQNDIIKFFCKCPEIQCSSCRHMNKNTCICDNPEYTKAKIVIDIIKNYKDKGDLLVDA